MAEANRRRLWYDGEVLFGLAIPGGEGDDAGRGTCLRALRQSSGLVAMNRLKSEAAASLAWANFSNHSNERRMNPR
jgi:hypothetical protein